MSEEVGLRRGVLGFWPVLAVCVGLVVAPSTLMVVCFGFAEVGPAFLVSMVIGGIIVALFANTISELMLLFPRAASFAEYAKQAFSPGVGIWQGMVFWVVFLGLAAEAMIMGAILSLFFPAVEWYWWALIIAAIFFIINFLGIVVAGWAELTVTVIFVAIFLVGALVQIAGGGLEPFSMATYGGFAPAGWGAVLSWALMAVWLFVGVTFPAPLIEEVKKPARIIPMAMFIGLVIIYVVQAVIGLAAGGTMPAEEVFGAEPMPMVIAGGVFFGPVGLALFAAAALAAGFGTFNAVMAGTSRVLWELGADGYLGKVIGYLHPKFRTPVTTLSMIFVIILILAFTIQDPVFIISICSMMFMIVYLAMHIYLIVLRNKRPDMERPHYAGGPFKAPILPILGIIGVASVWYYQVQLDLEVPWYLGVIPVGGLVAVVFAIISVLVWYLYAKKKVG